MNYRTLSLMVIILMAILAGCKDNSSITGTCTSSDCEPKAENILGSVRVENPDGDRITVANIEFHTPDSPTFKNKVVATNGTYQDSLLKENTALEIYAYADGYLKTDTVHTDLSDDFNEVIVLKKKPDEPEPEGPGKIEIDSRCENGPGSGIVTSIIENGATDAWLIDTESDEVVKTKTGLTPEDDQEIIFEGIDNGTFKVRAKNEGGEDTSDETTTVDCQKKEGPGDIDIVETSCADPGKQNGEIILVSENGADLVEVKRDGKVIDSRKNVKAGEEIVFNDNISASDHEVTFTKNSKKKTVSVTPGECQPTEGPGNIQITDTRCSDKGKANGSLTAKVENGANPLKIKRDGQTVDSEPNVAAGEKVTFDGLSPGTYTFVADKNGKTVKEDHRVEQCEVPNKAPEADFDYRIDDDNPLKVYFSDRSSDQDGTVDAYLYELGDGETSKKANPTHTYDDFGTYDVRETVTDNDGASDDKVRKLTLSPPDMGVITQEPVSCKNEQGSIQFHVQRGVTKYRTTNTKTGKVVDEDSDLDPAKHTTLNFTDLDDGKHKTELWRYSHKEVREFTVDCDKNEPVISGWKTVSITNGFDEEVFVSGHANQLKDVLLTYGEYRPILVGNGNIYGDVKFTVCFQTDHPDRGQFVIKGYWNEDGSDSFTTPVFKTNGTNRVCETVTLDGDIFAGHYRDHIGFDVIHVDGTDKQTPAGPDKVTLASESRGILGKVTTQYRYVVDDQAKISAERLEEIKMDQRWVNGDLVQN